MLKSTVGKTEWTILGALLEATLGRLEGATLGLLVGTFEWTIVGALLDN